MLRRVERHIVTSYQRNLP